MCKKLTSVIPVFFLASALVACGGGSSGGSGGSSAAATAPTISSLSFFPNAAYIDTGGGELTVVRNNQLRGSRRRHPITDDRGKG